MEFWFALVCFLVSNSDPTPRRIGGWILSKTNAEQRVLLCLLIKSCLYTSLPLRVVVILERFQWFSLLYLGVMETVV